MLSILFYVIFIAFTLAYFVVFSVVFFLTVLFDKNRVVMHQMSRLWTKVYFAIVPTWKVKVEGRENIEEGKPYVIVVNHRSMLDIILMYVLPMNFKWVAKKEVYRWPIFGWVLSMHADITIERGTSEGIKKLIKESREWLSRGVSVIIFPEGSRGKTDQVHRFKEGAFLMARSAGVDILPCVADGTGHAFKGWRLNFKNTYRVHVLPPVSAEQARKMSTKELTESMHELISAEYEKMKSLRRK